MGKTILLVDDEGRNHRYSSTLSGSGRISGLVAHDGVEALRNLQEKTNYLIITDIMMPRMDGYDLISEVQYQSPDQPFLFITAKTSEQDQIYGLSLGADDFIAKPFGPRELVLRVHNILRRLHRGGETEVVSLGNLRMNHGSHEVQVGDVALDLTVKSFELLWLLASNPEQVSLRQTSIEKVWQEDYGMTPIP